MTKILDMVLGGAPMGLSGIAEVKCLVEDEGLKQNIASALSRQVPRLGLLPEQPGRLAIVGSGPSAAQHLDELCSFDEIWAVNGAFCWLWSEGVKANVFICLDPDKGLTPLLPWKPPARYYLAAVCHETLFEWLSDRDVHVWFPAMSCRDTYPADAVIIPAATTCLVTAPLLALFQGFRDITIFGGDSSFEESLYCYGFGRYASDVAPHTVTWVKVGEKVFATNRQMMHQVANMLGVASVLGDMLKFRVGGLMAAMLAAPVHEVELQETEDAA